MKDGLVRRSVKAAARGVFYLNLHSDRARRHLLRERPYRLGGACQRCAACCEAPAIRVHALVWLAPTLRRVVPVVAGAGQRLRAGRSPARRAQLRVPLHALRQRDARVRQLRVAAGDVPGLPARAALPAEPAAAAGLRLQADRTQRGRAAAGARRTAAERRSSARGSRASCSSSDAVRPLAPSDTPGCRCAAGSSARPRGPASCAARSEWT